MTKNFRFADGLYFSLADFQANAPAVPLAEVDLRRVTNPQTLLTQVDQVRYRSTGADLPLDSLWGLCLDGIPFVHLPAQEVRKPLPTFAPLKVRGKICYFTYPDWRTKTVPVAAYNPLTGRPFLRSTVEREEQVVVEKMLHFETGEVLDFNRSNFLRWIEDDPVFLETVTSLPLAEQEEKLFKCLLIYDDRNLSFLRETN